MGVTIRELAEELQTSKTTIRNIYKGLGIEPEKVQSGKQLSVILSNEEAESVRKHFRKDVTGKTEKEVSGIDDNEYLKNLVKSLQEELEEERKHSRKLAENLLEINQKLLNVQETLTQSQLAVNQKALIDSAEPILTDGSIDHSMKKKKRFWSILDKLRGREKG